MQYPQRQGDHLQILTSRRGANVSWLGPDIIDDWFLQPGDQEMSALIYHRLLHSGETVEDDGAATAFDVVNGSLSEGEADGDGDSVAVDCTKSVGHIKR